jgi:hypothetical protein
VIFHPQWAAISKVRWLPASAVGNEPWHGRDVPSDCLPHDVRYIVIHTEESYDSAIIRFQNPHRGVSARVDRLRGGVVRRAQRRW